MLTNDELNLLESAKSDAEWDKACDIIRHSHGSRYPSDWYEKVIASGLSARVRNSFGGSNQIQVIPIRF